MEHVSSIKRKREGDESIIDSLQLMVKSIVMGRLHQKYDANPGKLYDVID